jgi:hypothetical protein
VGFETETTIRVIMIVMKVEIAELTSQELYDAEPVQSQHHQALHAQIPKTNSIVYIKNLKTHTANVEFQKYQVKY